MASKTLLFVLGLTVIAVAYASWPEDRTQELDEDEQLYTEDFEEYFTAQQVEKRGSKKIGSKLFACCKTY